MPRENQGEVMEDQCCCPLLLGDWHLNSTAKAQKHVAISELFAILEISQKKGCYDCSLKWLPRVLLSLMLQMWHESRLTAHALTIGSWSPKC